MSDSTSYPWHVGKDFRIIGADSNRIARCDDNEQVSGRRNSLLIAAAPKLLKALEQARAALPDAWFAVKCGVPKEVIELIDAAIAEAKGESHDGKN